MKGGGGPTRLMAPRTKHASRSAAVRTTVEDENAGDGKGTDDERDPSNKSENSEGEQEVSAGRTPLLSGWRCPLLGDRVLGQQLLTKPVWYNDARSGRHLRLDRRRLLLALSSPSTISSAHTGTRRGTLMPSKKLHRTITTLEVILSIQLCREA